MITRKSIDTDKTRTIVWFADAAKDVVPNPNGVTHEHPTEIIQGVVEFRFGEKTIVVKAGETVVLPLNLAYDVLVIEAPAEVQCHYPRDVEGAAESVEHLVAEVEVEHKTYATEENATPKSDTVVDWDGKPIEETPKDPVGTVKPASTK